MSLFAHPRATDSTGVGHRPPSSRWGDFSASAVEQAFVNLGASTAGASAVQFRAGATERSERGGHSNNRLDRQLRFPETDQTMESHKQKKGAAPGKDIA
jgi:hypothetical protein